MDYLHFSPIAQTFAYLGSEGSGVLDAYGSPNKYTCIIRDTPLNPMDFFWYFPGGMGNRMGYNRYTSSEIINRPRGVSPCNRRSFWIIRRWVLPGQWRPGPVLFGTIRIFSVRAGPRCSARAKSAGRANKWKHSPRGVSDAEVLVARRWVNTFSVSGPGPFWTFLIRA